jgi:hypothetical protein
MLTSDLTYLSEETDQIASWIVEQGKVAAADNVVQISRAA